MKRREVLRHLERHGCEPLREGGNHTIYVNRPRRKASSVPRHREINDFLVRKICATLRFLNREPERILLSLLSRSLPAPPGVPRRKKAKIDD